MARWMNRLRWPHAALALALTVGLGAQARTVVEGPYVGVLPCAQCPGTRTELALERDAASGTPLRYWLRETTLDANVGKRRHEFTAKAVVESPAAEQEASLDDELSADRPAVKPAPSLVDDEQAEGTGSIEATVDARRSESIGPWRLDAASGQQGERIVLQTAQGERYFSRASDRVLRAHGSKDQGRVGEPLQLRAGVRTPLAREAGLWVAGMVRQDAYGRLTLLACADQRAFVLTGGPGEASVKAALASLGFERQGQAFLEVYALAQEASALQVVRLARASTDLNCQTAQPAPAALAVVGWDGAWVLRADVDGVRLRFSDAQHRAREHGSTAQRLIWHWPDEQAQMASATLRSGAIEVRTQARLCRDTMANTVYGFAAQLKWGGQTYRGCAWSADQDQAF